MKSFHLRAAGLVVVVLVLAQGGCKRESRPARSGGNVAGTERSLTIEYETLPSILFEAESGLVAAPVALHDGAGASGGKYALAPEGPEHQEISIGGDVAYAIKAPEGGEYVLWLRANWSGGCGNSLGIALDGQDLGDVGDALYEQWHWVRLNRKKLALTTGAHTLTIVNREDGSAWDQVLLTRDEDYRPARIETADVRGRSVLTDTVPAEKPVAADEALPALEAGGGLQVIEAPPVPPAAKQPAPVKEEVKPALAR